MTRLTPIILGLTFVIAVVALWLVLMLFITKPWDDATTEAELSEILRAEQETSSEEKEAERVAKCASVTKLLLMSTSSTPPEPRNQFFTTILENDCLRNFSLEEILDLKNK